jgi:hypothetical protein
MLVPEVVFTKEVTYNFTYEGVTKSFDIYRSNFDDRRYVENDAYSHLNAMSPSFGKTYTAIPGETASGAEYQVIEAEVVGVQSLSGGLDNEWEKSEDRHVKVFFRVADTGKIKDGVYLETRYWRKDYETGVLEEPPSFNTDLDVKL